MLDGVLSHMVNCDTLAQIWSGEIKYDIIFIDEYLYTNTIEFYYNSNFITYSNSN